jgi:tetratricopeptide (TPR) repeat protein
VNPSPEPAFAQECAAFERLSMSDPLRAASEGDALLARIRACDDAAAFAHVSRSMANALAHVGRAHESIRRAAEARRFARRRAPVEAARMLITAMHPRAKLGNLQGARRAGEQAAREFTALGEPTLVARAELNLANVAKAMGQPQRATELIARVLAHGDAIASIRGQALNVLGEACVQMADLNGAQRAFESASEVFAAQGLHFACAVVAGNLAATAARAGRIEDALRGFREARNRFAELGAHADACRSAIEEATLLEYAGFLAEARDLARDSGASAEANGLAVDGALARLAVGRALFAAGDSAHAETELLAAASRLGEIGDGAAASQALEMLARCLRHRDRARALQLADAAVAAAREATAPIELAGALAVRASVAPDLDAAGRDAAEATSIADSVGIAGLRADAHAASAMVARRRGATSAAVGHGRLAFAEVESARRTLDLARTRRAFLARRSDVAAELATCLLADGSPRALDEAFDAVDRCRSLAILDAIARPARNEAHARPAMLTARARELLADLDPREHGRGMAVEAARVDREVNRADLDRALAARTVDPAPDFSSLRSLRAPCVSLLEHDDRIAVLARMPDGSTRARTLAATLPEVSEAESAFRFQVMRRLHGADGTRARTAAHAAAEALRALVEPALNDILDGWRGTVVLVHTGLFSRVPGALLIHPEHDACLAPSLEVASMLDRPSLESGQPLAGVVSVDDRLASAIAREGDAVERVLARRGPTMRLDRTSATRSNFIDALSRCTLGHIACHGVFPIDAPNLAGLKLADGWFTARDAHALDRAPAELVLSGCATASSARHDGEEWMGLVRGFAAAGTRRMIASLWPVDDEATAALMERLHATGPSPSAALAHVVRELRHEGEHPAIWGAFCPIGGANTFETCVSPGSPSERTS